MFCTAYSASAGINELNGIEQNKFSVPYSETIAPRTLVDIGLKSKELSEISGGSIRWPFSHLQKLGYISGYTWVTKEQTAIKNALVLGVICTGSNTIDWALLAKTGFIVSKISSGLGHAFFIIGYDDNIVTPFGKWAYIFHNSGGPLWGDRGRFYLPYWLEGALYSLLFPVDVSNASPLLRYKAKLKGIWNGERENETLSRYESATMCLRLNPSATGIWNEQNGDSPIIRQDFVTMLSRVIWKEVEWSKKEPFSNITRGEGAELIAKYL